MSDEQFTELLASAQEMDEIFQGDKEAARVTEFGACSPIYKQIADDDPLSNSYTMIWSSADLLSFMTILD